MQQANKNHSCGNKYMHSNRRIVGQVISVCFMSYWRTESDLFFLGFVSFLIVVEPTSLKYYVMDNTCQKHGKNFRPIFVECGNIHLKTHTFSKIGSSFLAHLSLKNWHFSVQNASMSSYALNHFNRISYLILSSKARKTSRLSAKCGRLRWSPKQTVCLWGSSCKHTENKTSE